MKRAQAETTVPMKAQRVKRVWHIYLVNCLCGGVAEAVMGNFVST